jgi:hypothetical protein
MCVRACVREELCMRASTRVYVCMRLCARACLCAPMWIGVGVDSAYGFV